MGLGKSLKKVAKSGKKLVKSGKKLVKSELKFTGKVVTSVTGLPLKLTGKIIKEVGGVLGGSIGREVERWGEDIDQVGKVISGEYHREVAEVKDYQKSVEAFGRKVEDAARAYANGYQPVAAYRQNTDELMEKLERLIAFDEIFKLALKNRFKDMDNTQTQAEDPRRVAQYKELQLLVKQYELMVRQLKQMMASLKADYDFVIGLTEGAFLQRIVGSVIMMVGGLVNNISNVLSGEATSEDWKNIIVTAIIVVAIVFTAGAAAAAGAAFAAGTGTALAAGLAMTALVLSIIGAFMTLDGMYANGAATGAIMSSLDFIFNDLLNLDDFVGKDFNKFDKDHEDYQEMVMYTQLAVAVGSLATSWGSSLANSGAPVSKEVGNASIMKPSTWNMGTASVHGTGVATNETAALAAKDTAAGITNTNSFFGGTLQIGDSLAQSSVFGLSFTTYSDIYEAFTIASNVKDMIAMNDQYNQLGNKLTKEAEVINVAIVENTIQKTRLHIADSAYFLQDQQEYIDRYIWSMVSDSMYVDPYGTTPVANIRFQPDKDTRVMNFGFEDMFDESKQAGSKGYFNNIIYGS